MHSKTRSVLFAAIAALVSCEDGDPSRPWDGASAGSTSGEHTDHGDHSGHDVTDDGAGDTTPPPDSASTGDAGGEPPTGTDGPEPAGSTGAAPVDTWESWAHPEFFEVFCNHCHPGDSPRDFSDYDTVVANEAHIRCGVAPALAPGCDGHIEPGHLPIGPGPYPDEATRWRLVDWVVAGMPRD
jgi:hypothetical protein